MLPQLSRALLALLTMLLLLACAPRSENQAPAMPSFNGIPDLATLATLTKAAASTANRPGAEFAQAGGTHTVNGSALELAPAAGELAFAIYSFTVPAGSEVQSVTVTGSSPQPTAWLGISDFAAGRWEFAEFDPSSGTVEVARPASELTASGCQFYVAVLAVAEALSIDSVEIEHNGNTLSWAHSWGTAEEEDGRFLALDALGNLYVAVDKDTAGQVHPTVLKYAPDGSLLASKVWTDQAIEGDPLGINDIKVTPQGEVYVGFTGGDPRNTFLLKADAELDLLWCRKWDAMEQDSLGAMGFDQDGNLVLSINEDGVDEFIALVWVDANGDVVRQLRMNPGDPATDPLYRRIAVEPQSGDLLMTGRRLDPLTNRGTLSLLRLSSSGNFIHSKQLIVSDPQYLNISFSENGVSYDDAGNMVAVCQAVEALQSDPSAGAMVLRIDPLGNLISAQSMLAGAVPNNLTVRRFDRFSAGLLVQVWVNNGSSNTVGLIRLDPADASPLDWQNFGILGFHLLEDCGSYFITGNAPSALGYAPLLTGGQDVLVTDIAGSFTFAETSDSFQELNGTYLSDQTSTTQFSDITGTLDAFDAAASTDATVFRFIP